MPLATVDEAKVKAAVDRAGRALLRDVVHIYYNWGSDWVGDPSIFFKVVLKDRSAKPDRLREVTQRVALKIMNEARTDQSGLFAYFSFRSESEHARLKDPDWS